MRFSSTAAACTALKVPRRHCADAGGQLAALRDKSRPSETAPESRDAAMSAIPPKTSGATESFRGPARAAPSSCPNSPTRLFLRLAVRLAGCNPQRSRHVPSVPSPRASASTHVPAQRPAPSPSPIRRAVWAVVPLYDLSWACACRTLNRSALKLEATESQPRLNERRLTTRQLWPQNTSLSQKRKTARDQDMHVVSACRQRMGRGSGIRF